MNKITALIQVTKLNDAKNALIERGVLGLTITSVQGYGRQRGHGATHLSYRNNTKVVEFQAKVRLEVVVSEELTAEVVEAIVKSCQTGSIGDGKIFISPVTQAVRIRTQDQDDAAL
jgi:nitrogen regulatory protein P-II 1